MSAMSKEMPCKYLLGYYKDENTQNGVVCDPYSFDHACHTCGFNPSVAHSRLIKICGEVKASELMSMTIQLSRKFRKEHPLL